MRLKIQLASITSCWARCVYSTAENVGAVVGECWVACSLHGREEGRLAVVGVSWLQATLDWILEGKKNKRTFNEAGHRSRQRR